MPEAVAVLVITSMVMLAVLGIYGQVKKAAASINDRLDENDLATEILQRIAEDLDRLASPGFDTSISVKNKTDSSGYNLSQLIIANNIFDKDNKPQTFEKVVWQSSYDEFADTLVLYRSYGGIALEDKVITDEIQADRQDRGEELFIPLCSGMTFFRIEVPGAKGTSTWTTGKLPKSVRATISFAEPYETETGDFEVAAEDMITRTIAIDRTRKIKYVFVKKDFEIHFIAHQLCVQLHLQDDKNQSQQHQQQPKQH